MDELDLTRAVQEHLDKHMPKQIAVPTDVSEDEAVEAVKKQFADVGEVTDEDAREIVRQARSQADDES
jgi:predicted phosphoribosyltransferase